jgi:hypothetical protein
MTQRMTREERWSRFRGVLANAKVAVKGEVACLDKSAAAGAKIVPAEAQTDLVPIGYFESDLTGDGTTKISVRLFKEITLHRFANDSGTAVAAGHVGQDCYFSDSKTVSMDATSRSIAGRVWDVDSALGVLVQPSL